MLAPKYPRPCRVPDQNVQLYSRNNSVYKLLNVFSYVNRYCLHKTGCQTQGLKKSCLLDIFDRYEGGTNFGNFNDISLRFTAFPPGKDTPPPTAIHITTRGFSALYQTVTLYTS